MTTIEIDIGEQSQAVARCRGGQAQAARGSAGAWQDLSPPVTMEWPAGVVEQRPIASSQPVARIT